jgi:thioredoxin-related protein
MELPLGIAGLSLLTNAQIASINEGMRICAVLFFAGFLVSCSPSSTSLGVPPPREGWMTDYRDALKIAKSANKKILLDFTGSGWCAGCIVLDREVFSKEAFKSFAPGKFVLVELDFPPQPELAQKDNAELAERFRIIGFPTTVVLDSHGVELARQEGYANDPPRFIAWLKDLAAR